MRELPLCSDELERQCHSSIDTTDGFKSTSYLRPTDWIVTTLKSHEFRGTTDSGYSSTLPTCCGTWKRNGPSQSTSSSQRAPRHDGGFQSDCSGLPQGSDSGQSRENGTPRGIDGRRPLRRRWHGEPIHDLLSLFHWHVESRGSDRKRQEWQALPLPLDCPNEWLRVPHFQRWWDKKKVVSKMKRRTFTKYAIASLMFSQVSRKHESDAARFERLAATGKIRDEVFHLERRVRVSNDLDMHNCRFTNGAEFECTRSGITIDGNGTTEIINSMAFAGKPCTIPCTIFEWQRS